MPGRSQTNGGYSRGGSCKSRVVLSPDVSIASDVSSPSKNPFAITDFLARKTKILYAS